MKKIKTAIYIITASVILFAIIVFSILTKRYLSCVKICQPFTIQLEGIRDAVNCDIKIYGITPFLRKINLEHIDSLSWQFDNYSSFSNLEIAGNKTDISEIKSVKIHVENKQYVISSSGFQFDDGNVLLIKDLDTGVSKMDVLKSIFHWSIFRTLIIISIFSLILVGLKQFSIIQKIQDISNHLGFIKQPYLILICLLLFLVYITIFLSFVRYENTVKIQGDSFGYQFRGVNYALKAETGNGDLFLKYMLSKETIDKRTGYEYALQRGPYPDIACPPVYPMFLGIVYRIFGVSPAIARYSQLIMLLLVASFFPYLGFLIRQKTGFCIGLLSGLIFILIHYKMAEEIMTESIQIFTLFIASVSVLYFERQTTFFTAFLTGILLAISLLVKGIILMIPIFYFMYVFILSLNQKYLRAKLAIMIVSFLFIIMPWTIYANIHSGFIVKDFLSKKDLGQFIDEIDKLIHKRTTSTDSVFVSSFRDFINSDVNLSKLVNINFITQKDISIVNNSIIDAPFLSVKEKADSIVWIINKIDFQFRSFRNSPSIDFLGNTFTFNLNKFVLISTNSEKALLESNNKTSIDGDWHRNDSILKTYDENLNKPGFIRVIIFYYKNHGLIPIIFLNKLHLAFRNYLFFSLLIILIILDFIVHKTKLNISKYQKWFFPVSIVTIAVLTMVCSAFKPVFLVCFFISLILIVFAVLRKTPLIIFRLPAIFLISIISFILVTLIFYGSERFISIISWIIIFTALFHFFELIRQFYGNEQLN